MKIDKIKKIVFNPMLVFVQNFIPVYLFMYLFLGWSLVPSGLLNNKIIELYFITKFWAMIIYTPISIIWSIANSSYCKKNRKITRITQDTLYSSMVILFIYSQIISVFLFITHVGI